MEEHSQLPVTVPQLWAESMEPISLIAHAMHNGAFNIFNPVPSLAEGWL